MVRAALALTLTTTAAIGGPLWEWEIEAAFVDRAFTYEWPEGSETQVGIIAYVEGGALLLRGPDGYQPAGSWRVQGDRLCMAAEPIQGGREACVKVEPIGDKYVTSHGLELLPSSDVSFLTP